MARLEGFEPPTARFVAEYSIQLSYRRFAFLPLRQGANNADLDSVRQLLFAKYIGFSPITGIKKPRSLFTCEAF